MESTHLEACAYRRVKLKDISLIEELKSAWLKTVSFIEEQIDRKSSHS